MVQQPTQPVQQPVVKQVVQPVGAQPQAGQLPVQKKKKWWIWVIVAVVVIGILGALAYFFL